MNFWPDFIKLKTSIGGNREQYGYEETFGQPMEEQHHITLPAPHHKRIISQLEFAIRLNEAQNGVFNEPVRAALEHLLDCLDTDGVLTKSACARAEALLMPCRDAAKEYKLILAGHAHLDMDWMWSYHETVASTLATFRTVLNLMDQYPDFHFSQSQASVYRMVEEYDPDMMTQIQKRIREGRWEVTASAWVETDKNMPSTESLLRHIRYTKNYLSEVWGVDPDSLQIDFSPDTFGHSAFIPEIDGFGGVKYMYHCRALDGDPSLYRWRAPSGRELLVYREQYWYNSGITPKIGLGLIDISKTCAGFKTGLIVYGVGDHGGGPTRRDIEAAMDMQRWPVWPTVKFGTFAEFFREAEALREQLPVIDHELNYIFSGCYTTQTRIKRANRRAEALLGDTESWLAFSGRRFDRRRHEQAWQHVLYAHFHDIITGSCVQDTRENAMGQFSRTLAYAQTQFRNSVEQIAASIDTSSIQTDADIALTQSEGAGCAYNMGANLGIARPSGVGFSIGFNNGVPNPERGCGKTRIFHIFNSTPNTRRMVTELTIWDWVGDIRRIRFTDARGGILRHQLVDGQSQWFWDHRFLRILVETEVPALGYTTVILREEEADSYPVYRQPQCRSEYPFNDIILENDLICARFHRNTGCLISLRDRQTGEEFLSGSAGLAVIAQERSTNNAWKIGRYLKTEPLTDLISIEHKTDGPLQKSFTASYQWGQSKMKLTPILQAGERALRFCIEVEWNEVTGADSAPLLVFRVPHSEKIRRYLCDVPAGCISRQPRNQDIPCLQFCAAIRENGSALALIPDSKYGYRATEDALSVSLINTSNYPDPFPDRGLHTVNIALALGQDDPKALEDTAFFYNHPAYFLSNNSHPGTLPLEQSFARLEAASTVLSAVLPTEDPRVIHIRFQENGGSDDPIVLHFSKAPSSAVSVDLNGREVASDVRIQGNCAAVTARASSLGELRITF